MKLMTTCAHFTSPRGETTFLLIVSGASEKEKGLFSSWPQAIQEEKDL